MIVKFSLWVLDLILLIRDNGIDGVTLITSKLNKISIDKDGIITANCGAFDAEVVALQEIMVELDLSF